VLDGLDRAVATAFERACTRLSAAGARLTSLAVPEFAELGALHARGTLAGAEAWAWHRDLLAVRAAEYDPRVSSRIRGAQAMDAADYINLLAARRRWAAQVEARIAGFDALLMPTVPMLAPPIAELQASDAAYAAANALILRNPTLINLLDGCALSLPCHAPGEAPVGLMLAGAALRDAPILALGQAVERALAA
jgi:aspartyl-tRNA(Asn)/glutamyl-tRNA(Gln) amidotransferase subunit A